MEEKQRADILGGGRSKKQSERESKKCPVTVEKGNPHKQLV